MSLARDGSFGVLAVWWRTVAEGEAFLVHESWNGEPGILYGPMADRAACITFIKARVAVMSAAFRTFEDELLATHGGRRVEKHALVRLDEQPEGAIP